MAKWSRIETVLTPFLMAKQARESGDLQGSENYAKRATDMMGSLVEMAKLKQQIDMAPSEISYKKALEGQAYGQKEQSLSIAEKNRAEIVSQKNEQDAMIKAVNILAPQLGVSPDVLLSKLDIGKTAKDIGSLYQTTEDIKGGLYPAKTYQETQEALDKGRWAEQSGIQNLPTFGTQEKVAEAQAGTEFIRPSTQAKTAQEIEKATTMGHENTEEYRAAQRKKMEREATSSGESPFDVLTRTMSATTSMENVLFRYKQLQIALNSKDTRASSNALIEALAIIGNKTAVTDANKEQLMAEANKGLSEKQAEIQSRIDMTLGMSNKLGGPDLAKPYVRPEYTPVLAEGKTIRYTKEVWDKMPYEQQKPLFDRYKILTNEGESLLLKPDPKAKPTTKVAPPPEKPVGNAGTGNKVVEKPTNSKKAQDAITILKKAKITSIKQLSAERILAMKQQGIYDEVVKYLGE
jgi:hypothetical protein